MKKRIFAIMLALTMLLSLTACGSQSASMQQSLAPNATTPSATGPSPGTSSMTPDGEQEEISGLHAINSTNITHLDDFQQYGFTYEPIPEEKQYQYFGGALTYGLLVSDNVTIYVGNSVFTYQIDLPSGNPKDLYDFSTAIPGVQDGEAYTNLDVGYGISLPDMQMDMMAIVAKRFYENPSAPFADIVPDSVADAAAENDVFIAITYNALRNWVLHFVSAENGYVKETYSDGSQNIVVRSIWVLSDKDDKTKVYYCIAEGLDFGASAWKLLSKSVAKSDNGNLFNPETLEWSFTPDATSSLVELMQALNTPY